MLDLLILLPLFMVGLLNLTFQISVDEITDVSRKSYFSLQKYEENGYKEILDKVSRLVESVLPLVLPLHI